MNTATAAISRSTKYQQWIAAGKSYAQISNNLSALKYHAEKKAA